MFTSMWHFLNIDSKWMCHKEFVAKRQKQEVHIAYFGKLGIIESKKVFGVDLDPFRYL